MYQEIRKLLPNLHYLYAFDNKGFPYGQKSASEIIKCIISIVNAISQRFQLSLVVIACNSASIVSLPFLRKHFTFPIVGVVPAIKPATCLTRNGVIGLLATHGTVKSNYIQQLITQFAHECKIEMLSSSKLVELAEAKLHGEIINLADIREIIKPWLCMQVSPDTIVLGCTHFPLLRHELQSILSDKIQLVDSGTAIARRIGSLLKYNKSKKKPFSKENIAFCTRMDNNTMQLVPVLQYYGFHCLKKLIICNY
ncbi:hypothetical protein HHS_01180 [Candidatus Pantoea carbekii]|uniref:Glutamate racemase n=1 Tax=Candidatus Pantoea carbekii TaxID=1235990 RepID=U3U8V9_9GAMM|nr:hypothetical protein HHS_01180 [Candidatus Pantoea carbekii]